VWQVPMRTSALDHSPNVRIGNRIAAEAQLDPRNPAVAWNKPLTGQGFGIGFEGNTGLFSSARPIATRISFHVIDKET
jgi:hypothetical protein